MTAQGRAVLTWREGDPTGPAQVAIAPPGGRFGTPRPLGDAQGLPVLAAAPDGTVIASWIDAPPSPQPPPAPAPTDRTWEVYAATLAPGASRFGAATQLDSLQVGISGPGVGSGPGGAAVYWRFEGMQRRLVSVLPGGVFTPAVATPPMRTAAGIGLEDELSLGLPSNGSTVAVWQDAVPEGAESSGLASSVVSTSTRLRGGIFGAPRTLSARGLLAGAPEAGALTDRTVAAWSEGSKATPARLRVAVRYRGAWTVRAPISTPGADSNSLALAAGRAHVPMVWIQRKNVREPGGAAYLATYRP